jgi:hypothetical protein
MGSSSAPLAMADSRDVFGPVSENERRAQPGHRAERGRAIASVLASVSGRGTDVATAVCIRHATPPSDEAR